MAGDCLQLCLSICFIQYAFKKFLWLYVFCEESPRGCFIVCLQPQFSCMLLSL